MCRSLGRMSFVKKVYLPIGWEATRTKLRTRFIVNGSIRLMIRGQSGRGNRVTSEQTNIGVVDAEKMLAAFETETVGASTEPTSMALTCRWRSRPQHQ